MPRFVVQTYNSDADQIDTTVVEASDAAAAGRAVGDGGNDIVHVTVRTPKQWRTHVESVDLALALADWRHS
jgi:hypothetical protein